METELYNQVKISVKKLLGIELNHYKDEQMRRRLDAWLVRTGAESWDQYFKRVFADSNELSRFRNYLTINVSEFFRDPERWLTLRTQVLPDLIRDSRLRSFKNGPRIWSAGCSIGPEPYTLAILLSEMGVTHNHLLLATDLDRGALARARGRGPYATEDIRNVNPAERSNYFDAGGPPFFVTEKLAHLVTFKEQDMLQDAFEDSFDLIVCRNVIIYFTTEAKNILYTKFSRALRPGGILFLGGTEIIPKPQDFSLQSQGFSFYKKVQIAA